MVPMSTGRMYVLVAVVWSNKQIPAGSGGIVVWR
jgi:hypothetical protein